MKIFWPLIISVICGIATIIPIDIFNLNGLWGWVLGVADAILVLAFDFLYDEFIDKKINKNTPPVVPTKSKNESVKINKNRKKKVKEKGE